ncbi:unnamed protein product [Ilex paraguariensis]|uniref:TF-B3 domain-containing protein n=1 Tax=Ilex paraguariensis TaxID=185542 RepID=A0ABC8SZK6_9AQUA
MGFGEMEPQFVCFTKRLSRTDVRRNLEIPNGALFLPAGNGVMRVRDRHGVTYQFVASERIGRRRSLTQDWIPFAAAKTLEVDAMLRIYWSGDGNEYVVQEGVQLFGPHIAWLTL